MATSPEKSNQEGGYESSAEASPGQTPEPVMAPRSVRGNTTDRKALQPLPEITSFTELAAPSTSRVHKVLEPLTARGSKEEEDKSQAQQKKVLELSDSLQDLLDQRLAALEKLQHAEALLAASRK